MLYVPMMTVGIMARMTRDNPVEDVATKGIPRLGLYRFQKEPLSRDQVQ